MARPKKFDKEEVLKLATEIFWRKGFEATSVQDLVEQTKVNKQSLYDTFGDKHSLYLAALCRYRAESENQFGCLAAENISPKTVLRKLFENVIAEAVGDSEQKGCFINNAMIELAAQDEKIGKICLESMSSMETRLARLVKKGQEAGEIAESLKPETVAAFLFAALNGLRAVSKITPDENKLKEIAETTLSIFD
jgi:TetR/AcrR family transcriptional regulator, transcriptional repressor for nem operon